MDSTSTEQTDHVDPQAPSSDIQAQGRVKGACQRCRRQKLKCDIRRPCTLCMRAGSECIPGKQDPFKVHQTRQCRQRPEAVGKRASPLPASKRLRTNDKADAGQDRVSTPPPSRESRKPGAIAVESKDPSPSVQEIGDQESAPTEPLWNSSSTMVLVEKAFQYHEPDAPKDTTTSAFAASPQFDHNALDHGREQVARYEKPWDSLESASYSPYIASFPSKASRPNAMTLLSLLPAREVTALLVDTYFDRVHWFMLVFHQEEFRSRVQLLYENPHSQSTETTEAFPFAATLLTVVAIGLQYAGEYRGGLLARFRVDPHVLKEQIFSTLRSKILDIVSSGSLEAVQTCILLGSYYLYHGNPGLAMPIFGCGLRVAQALNLHRRVLMPDVSPASMTPALRQKNEARKRCWWTIYEIETFCCMLYGYPRSISDEDCDIELLDPSANSPETNAAGSSRESQPSGITLLSYKYFMSRLSIVIKSALTDLYGTRQDPTSRHRTSSDRSSRLQKLIKRVSDLDRRLRKWHADLPPKLQVETYRENVTDPSLTEGLDRDIGASGERFESHLFRLQALALKLAYENARILIHRPLVSFRIGSPSSDAGPRSANKATPRTSDPFQVSLQACRDAALQTAEVGSMSVFHEALDSYAVAFIGIHLFTAGVTLCIMTSLEPMSMQSHEFKIGIHKLMEMEMSLKPKSVLAAHGLEILKKLATLILAKELEKMLDFSKSPIKVDRHSDRVLGKEGLTQNNGQHQDDDLSSQSEPLGPPQLRQNRSGVSLPPNTPSATGSTPEMTDSLEMGNDLDFSFLEDPAMAEALLDFDQVISQCVRDQSSNEIDPKHASGFYQVDNGFADQEQAWIWGTDPFPLDWRD